MERTFIAIKPDGVQRGLIGKIITRIEEKGFKITGLKMLQVSDEQAAAHYAEHVGKGFYKDLVKFITSSPIVAMVVEGENAVTSMRQLMGKTNPAAAEIGTIRGDFSQEMSYNTIHGSDSPESAEREIAIYFKPEEICENWHTMFELLKAKLES
ncbi:MAG: nucleoside-diphosphate kinase [Sphaerochaetaceae bacterium]|nr:nucleoside-diphosphate kinase [Sphaerochaetaceae bacterium]